MGLEKLFLPGKIGQVQVKNRLIMSPMSTHLVAGDGGVTRELIDYYEERAKGGVGLIIVEGTHAEMEIAQGSITGANMRIDHNKYVIGLSELTDAVHLHGAKIFLQLTTGQGSLCHPFLYPKGVRPIAPSAVINPGFPDWKSHELTVDEIQRIIEGFAEAALRAKMADFDGMDINGHGMYLLSQFMSPYTNKRTDKYGDPAAFPLELIQAVRGMVGNDFPISFRWNIDEFLEGGRDLKRSQDDAQLFEKAGMDLINISGGNFWVPGSVAHSCPPMSYPQGHLRHLAKAMKSVVNIPIMLSSKIADPQTGDEILKRGEADFIGLGRGLLADPDWPNKAAQGRFDDIRPCIRDMDGCINRVIEQRRISCTVNPANGMEAKASIRPTDNPMKVVVVGGGVGGMEAARVAALRGHEVTLIEAKNTLGGQARLASMVPHKEDIARFMRYLEREVEKAGVAVKLGQEATAELILSLEPGAVVLATGSRETAPQVPGIDGANVLYARDVVAEAADVKGEKVVVAGGGFVGRDAALFLTEKRQKQVLIVEQQTLEAAGAAPYDANTMDLMKKLYENGVEIMAETKVEEIYSGGVMVSDKDGEKSELECGSIVLALGVSADRGLEDALRNKIPRLYTVGDCNNPGKIFHAMRQGYFTALRI